LHEKRGEILMCDEIRVMVYYKFWERREIVKFASVSLINVYRVGRLRETMKCAALLLLFLQMGAGGNC